MKSISDDNYNSTEHDNYDYNVEEDEQLVENIIDPEKYISTKGQKKLFYNL